MTSLGSFQSASKRKTYFYAFGQCFRLILDIAPQKSENMLTLKRLRYLTPPRKFFLANSNTDGDFQRNLSIPSR